MHIKVRFFTVLREITGKKEETIEFSEGNKVTAALVLETLAEKYGKPFESYVFNEKTNEVKGFLQFLINGQSATALNGLETELHEGDVLAIVPPVGGG